MNARGRRHSYRPWTPQEVERLHHLYPRHGVRGTAHLLHRSPQSVRWRASQEGLRVGDVVGRLTLAEVAASAECDQAWVQRAAERDGVPITRAGRGPRGQTVRLLVPEAWARTFIAEHRARADAEALVGHWYGLADVAELFGTGEKQVTEALRHRRTWLAKWLADTPYRIALDDRLLIAPSPVQHAARAYRRMLREWWTLEQVARTWGVPLGAVRHGSRGRGHLAPLLTDVPRRRDRGPNGRIEVLLHAATIRDRTERVHALRATLGLPIDPPRPSSP